VSVFPEHDEAYERMVLAIRSLSASGQRDTARYLLDLFGAAMDDGDLPKMRTVLGKAEEAARDWSWT
jgi:hypothetical protein